MIESSTKVRVRFAETDAMGVVYHANYLPWCEAARIDLISGIGLSYNKMHTSGIHLPVIEAHLNYKYPAVFDDIVTIHAAIKSRPNVRIKVEYEITANGKILATGHTVHVFVNDKGLPIKPPKDIAEKLLKDFQE